MQKHGIPEISVEERQPSVLHRVTMPIHALWLGVSPFNYVDHEAEPSEGVPNKSIVIAQFSDDYHSDRRQSEDWTSRLMAMSRSLRSEDTGVSVLPIFRKSDENKQDTPFPLVQMAVHRLLSKNNGNFGQERQVQAFRQLDYGFTHETPTDQKLRAQRVFKVINGLACLTSSELVVVVTGNRTFKDLKTLANIRTETDKIALTCRGQAPHSNFEPNFEALRF